MLFVINIIAKENLFLGLPIIQAIMRRTKKITQTYLFKYLMKTIMLIKPVHLSIQKREKQLPRPVYLSML